ncbi:MAG: hypothetical protein HKN48_06465 [Flavobacteriaceae bacterium]|nr:hypothetical protein [Flavobacteriaceae bacterium]
MKQFLILAFCTLFFASCNKDDGNDVNQNNPFLTSPLVNLQLNLNLPEYNPLKFPGNSVVLNSQGIKGVIIYNVNNSLYTAFDLTDPNHTPSSCSKMEVEGIVATCPCGNDENSYDIVTGQHQNDTEAYPMQQYRIQRSGDVITVTN